jgi:hypothetical protein
MWDVGLNILNMQSIFWDIGIKEKMSTTDYAVKCSFHT